MTEAKRRLALIALDAASLDFLRDHIGALPNLAGLLQAGRLSKLTSTADLFPSSIWPAFASEQLPQENGAYGALQWDSEQMRLRTVTGDWPGFGHFWVDIENRGRRVLCVDVPFAFDLRLREGVQLAEWSSHDRFMPFRAHPPELRREVARRFGSDILGPEVAARKTPGQLRELYRRLLKSAEARGRLVEMLATHTEWDLLLLAFTEVHRGGHLFFPFEGGADRLLSVYQAVDAALGRIIRCLPEGTALALFTVHGMAPNLTQDELLTPVVDRINLAFTGATATAPRQGLPGRLVREVRGRIPQPLQYEILRRTPQEVKHALIDKLYTAGVDWSTTPGVPILSEVVGFMRLNLRGRERLGMLEPGGQEEDRYRALIERTFMGLQDEQGRALVEEVRWPTRELSGSRVHMLPDVVVRWNPIRQVPLAHSDPIGQVTVSADLARRGTHTNEAFFLALGEAAQLPQPSHITGIGAFARAFFERGS